MKTQEEIQAKIQNYIKMLDREENQNEVMEMKIYTYIDALQWVLNLRK